MVPNTDTQIENSVVEITIQMNQNWVLGFEKKLCLPSNTWIEIEIEKNNKND